MIAVIFEADVHPQAGERYLQLASELKPLLAEIPWIYFYRTISEH